MRVILMMRSNQYTLHLYQAFKNHLQKLWIGLLISLKIMSNRSVSSKALIVLALGKKAPRTSLKINSL